MNRVCGQCRKIFNERACIRIWAGEMPKLWDAACPQFELVKVPVKNVEAA